MISLNDYEVERKINHAISKFPSTLKPTKQQFLSNAVDTYIKLLRKERIIKN